MNIARPALYLALTLTSAQQQQIPGTLNDRVVAEGMTQIELRPSDDRDLPGVSRDDRVFVVRTPQFRPAGAPDGLLVALVEGSEGSFLFVDTNVDGRLSASERTPYALTSSPEVSLTVTPPGAGAAGLPFRCRVLADRSKDQTRRLLLFTASFRAEGYADVGGRRTLVSLPFNPAQGTIDVRRGLISLDANGDGRIDLRGVSTPEVMFARNERVIFRVGDRYVSVESADFAARAFTLREHAPEEYRVIDVRVGEPLPDFEFTDFSGRAGKLSNFRGKYVLLDFWGSWCGPCVADVPHMQAAYARFRDRGFEILGLDFEHSASTEKVRAFLESKGVSWPNATPDSVRDLVEHRFRIMAFPTLILLDREGRVIEARSPALRGKALMATLEQTFDECK